MNCEKIGRLIKDTRIEMNLTQKQLSNLINVSDKTISKWECGLGCPDISLLESLSDTLTINIDVLLSGEIDINNNNGGNMKKTNFYMCDKCNNIITSSNKIDISCCGKKLKPLDAKKCDDNHLLSIDPIENDYFIKFNHNMEKDHYISFVATVINGGFSIIKLYPEQNPELRLPKTFGNKIYFHCTKHGLFTS